MAFKVVVNKNYQVDDGPLMLILSNEMKNTDANYDDMLVENFSNFFDLISKFGVGMIIFPTLVR